jgi:hypothetical protein
VRATFGPALTARAFDVPNEAKERAVEGWTEFDSHICSEKYSE